MSPQSPTAMCQVLKTIIFSVTTIVEISLKDYKASLLRGRLSQVVLGTNYLDMKFPFLIKIIGIIAVLRRFVPLSVFFTIIFHLVSTQQY